jgi:hypothetical protein
MEKYIISHVENFCEQLQTNRLEGQWDSPKNLSSLCNFLFFDIMGDLSFGDSFGMLTKPENHFVIDLIEKTVRRQQIVSRVVFKPTTLSLLLNRSDIIQFSKIWSWTSSYSPISQGGPKDSRNLLNNKPQNGPSSGWILTAETFSIIFWMLKIRIQE